MVEKVSRFIGAFHSIFVGMGITMKYLFSKPVTVQYPYERRVLAPAWRGEPRLIGIMGEDPLEILRAEHSEAYNGLLNNRIDEERLPGCISACPANVDVRGQNAYVAEGKYEEALDLVRSRNILPGVLGRICHHPCEEGCRRNYYDESIANRSLHRFISDICHQRKTGKLKRPVVKRDKKVAIIGSGPAGLAAAHDLAQLGCRVTIFEKIEVPGGALRIGVPTYRLPRNILQREIDSLLDLGIELKTGVEIGKDIKFKKLQKDHDAVLIACGLFLSRGLNIPGAELDGVLLALPFLRAANFGEKVKMGQEVIVVGGGNVAIDVARVALRLGAKKVKLTCLEARHEMPAHPWEIEEALEEGIEINCSWGPKAVLGKNSKTAGLQIVKCTSVFDKEGRFAPTFCEEETKVLDGDTVIIAIGQYSDLSFLKDAGVEINERGQLVLDREALMTSVDGVFATGEVVTGPGSAIGSIASGHEAAISIDRYLSGLDLKEGRTKAKPVIPEQYPKLPLEALGVEAERQRAKMPMLSPKQRVVNFKEIELGFSKDQAVHEGARCLRCLSETCVGCKFCMRACPDWVIEVERGMTDDGRRVVHLYQFDIGMCLFCGLCVEACPTKTLKLTSGYELSCYKRDNNLYTKEDLKEERGACR